MNVGENVAEGNKQQPVNMENRCLMPKYIKLMN
jgi:hypothetical protein